MSGTTAHPFLARLRLEWTNGSLNPPQEVDHWVEVRATVGVYLLNANGYARLS
jgi:hypothetical protein